MTLSQDSKPADGAPNGDVKTSSHTHPDFHSVEASRPAFDKSSQFRFTRTVDPDWSFGDGANETGVPSAKHISIAPYEEGRVPNMNYKLLISSVVPRPIAFISTRSADGTITNLAPFSFFSLLASDPPLFTVGFVSGLANPKDTLRNLLESKECVINIISEGFIEAANSTSIDAPYGASEWDVSGLTPVYDCKNVKCARVKEAVVSIEGKLDFTKEYQSPSTPGKASVLAVIEGTNFWVREDAIDETKSLVDPAVLRPVSRMGGITYGRTTEALEIPRAVFAKDMGGMEGFEKLTMSKK